MERPEPAAPPGFREALRFWALLGCISFGGPAGQIGIMHRELVEKRGWISEERFLHALNFCMLLPGPEAQQLATYVGWSLHRIRGGLAAGVLFVLPSVAVLLLLSWIYVVYGNVSWVAGILAGFKPVVVAIVAHAVWRIGRRALHRAGHVALAAAAFVGMYLLDVPFPLIVLGAGLAGLAGARWWPGAFARRGAGEPRFEEAGPPEPRGSGGWRRALTVALAGILLWLLPYLALLAWRGADSVHAAEYRFFTQAALVTFGGAYAVLAYVTQAVTGPLGWLTNAQALDGLALAETTPGPLIMVVQFVGFVAAWGRPEGMDPLASAVVGALVTTWVTFLPSLVFVLAGAPHIEALRGNRLLDGALTGVTAAVVGVILHLAVLLGGSTLRPAGADGPDVFAIALLAAAFVVLARRRVSVPLLVIAGGVAGLLENLLA
ncbi:MAG TPA: chromate efflux transporter [Gemmatimonadota bacterium]|nr:chromate efflux transporter [Gemmatimonadota bacterium]